VESLGDVDEIVHVADLHQAAAAEGGPVQLVARSQARRVRGRRLAAHVGVADLPDQNRLAELQRALADVDQAATVGDRFHEGHHDLDVVALDQSATQSSSVRSASLPVEMA
jgi:hypothetical protein